MTLDIPNMTPREMEQLRAAADRWDMSVDEFARSALTLLTAQVLGDDPNDGTLKDIFGEPEKVKNPEGIEP